MLIIHYINYSMKGCKFKYTTLKLLFLSEKEIIAGENIFLYY